MSSCSRAIAALVLCAAIVPAPSMAAGTLRVQQSDDSVQVYHDVTLRREQNDTLAIIAPNHRDRLVVHQGACSYLGSLERCLLDSVTLDKNGTSHDLHFVAGTIYANPTSDPQHLPYSSQMVPPKGVVMALRSKAGTYVSLHGVIDQVIQ
jgi:hypothetical protein